MELGDLKWLVLGFKFLQNYSTRYKHFRFLSKSRLCRFELLVSFSISWPRPIQLNILEQSYWTILESKRFKFTHPLRPVNPLLRMPLPKIRYRSRKILFNRI